MTKFLAVFLCMLVSYSVDSQTYWCAKPGRIDSLVKAMRITTHDLEVLSDTLFVPFNTDSEKVRAIYCWMTQNIAYDWDKYQHCQSNPLPEGMDEEKWEYKQVCDIVKKRKGVCGDYANLFEYLCESAHVRCAYITGYGKGPLTKFLFATGPESNHAWNAVLINNKWYLMDVTWAAGTIIDNGKKIAAPRNDKYYLCSPEVFIKDHHPDLDEWQLLPKPLDPKEWVKQATE